MGRRRNRITFLVLGTKRLEEKDRWMFGEVKKKAGLKFKSGGGGGQGGGKGD